MEVLEFCFLKTSNKSDNKWKEWSRVYEYPYIIDKLKVLGANNNSLIHNSSWGYTELHKMFKDELDSVFDNCIHSDIRPSLLDKTFCYDITKKIDNKYNNYFDFVINISTIEEVGYNNVEIIKNLFEQVKIGGYLIVTFDYIHSYNGIEGNGSINLESVSQFINKNINNDEPSRNITGNNSTSPMPIWGHLQCGVLIIKKIE
jgi:hypothetical protein